MKQFLLLSGALALAVTAQAATPRTSDDFIKKSHQRYEQGKKGPRYASVKGVWLPGTRADYSMGYEEPNDWVLVESTTFEYNELGQKIKEEANGRVITYEYTSKGQLASRTSIDEYGGYKNEYTYDDITGKETGSANYTLVDNQWVVSDQWEMRITRNEDNNITRIEEYSKDYETGELQLSSYRVYTYGTDGKINEIVNYDVWQGETEVEFHLKDIVWENTNGQLIVDDTNDMDADDYCMGKNRVKSATLLDFDGDEGITAYMTAEYTGTQGDLKMKMSINNTVFYTYEFSLLDENGSYSEYVEETDYDVDGTNVTFGSKDTEKCVEKYDSYGIRTEYMSDYKSESYEYSSKEIAEVTYDSEYGYPTEVIFKSSYGSDEELAPYSRQVFSDYALYTGVESPVVEDNAPVEYYNLQGVRVTNPATGIYIRRQGTSVSKVLIR